jgi:hydroxymethylglutaryl-CoA lyase
MEKKSVKLIECPRDAMQGWPHQIDTDVKVAYLNKLLKVGFDTLDFGSFVSPKAIPQMADTAQVLERLELSDTKLLAIIANVRGAETAVQFKAIQYLGFPFSISPTFQHKNTNSTIEASLDTVKKILELSNTYNKQPVVYLSMGFGNPYGDPFHADILMEWMQQLAKEGVQIMSVADTVGLATPEQVYKIMSDVKKHFSDYEIGVHLHSAPDNRVDKLSAALRAGVLRFDGALKGIGGCPMSGNDLVGNMDTEVMVDFFEKEGYTTGIDHTLLKEASMMSASVFI